MENCSQNSQWAAVILDSVYIYAVGPMLFECPIFLETEPAVSIFLDAPQLLVGGMTSVRGQILFIACKLAIEG